MSIRLMTMVWDSEAYSGGTLLVLLALADFGGDDGRRIFPKVETLAKKARLSIRATQNALETLKRDLVLLPVANATGGRGKVAEYQIDVERVQNLRTDEKGAVCDDKGCSSRQERVQKKTERVQIPTAHIDNHQEPSREPSREPPLAAAQLAFGVASPPPPAIASPEFLRLPTNRFESSGEEVPITEQFVQEFQNLYPAVDVRAELRKMRGWLLSKPKKRKTRKGMSSFVNSWLANQQDRVPRETSFGDRNGREKNRFTVQPAAAAVDQALRERGGGGFFDSGGSPIIDITPKRDSEGDPGEEASPRHPAHAA